MDGPRWRRTDHSLISMIAAIDPAFTGALLLPATWHDAAAGERSPAIPPDAKDLGDKTSAYKPSPGGGTAWCLTNQTGLVTKKLFGQHGHFDQCDHHR